jgi:RNA polymerase sigma factor (sigma-70 family)
MLDNTTLNNLDDLSADTLYELEVKSLKQARLSREEQASHIERARRGDMEAREVLILNCLHYAITKAYAVYFRWNPCHIDPLDLVQEANLAMVEKIDYALQCGDPIIYLVTLAAKAIQRYCIYNAPMIQRPHYVRVELIKADPSPVTVESLDELMAGGNRGRTVIIKAPTLRLESDDEQHQQYRYHPLFEAVKRLTRVQRALMIRHYGLFGQPAETYSEIAESLHLKSKSVRGRCLEARRNLERALDSVLLQMLRPKPASDEEGLSA